MGLVLCNAIWAANPLMGKLLMAEFLPLQVSWLRYSSALFAAVGLVVFARKSNPALLGPSGVFRQRNIWPWLFLAGIAAFFGSATLQYWGLHQSTSTANAIIVAVEPLFAVLIAWLLLGEKFKLNQIFGFLLAIIGFLLLSHINPAKITQSFALFNMGNLFILLATPMEAIYSVVSRKLAGKLKPLPIFAYSLPIGFFIFTILVAATSGIPNYTALSLKGWLAVLWLGPLSTTGVYIYWTMALIQSPVATVSLTLFIQPILGAIFGMVFLGESLNFWQSIGATLILCALFLQTYLQKGKS